MRWVAARLGVAVGLGVRVGVAVFVGTVVAVNVGFGVDVSVGAGGANVEQADNERSNNKMTDNFGTMVLRCIYPPGVAVMNFGNDT
jgi:hypothetical protein